jgi:thiol-disulfide isomerase/thioredoxin
LRHQGGSAADPLDPADVRLATLRQAAALQPCPRGLGPELPAATLPCLGGGDPVPLGSLAAGTPMLVNIWATWCGPCVREVPVLVEFNRRAAGRVGVVGVLHQDVASNALEFARQSGMTYPSVVDEDGDVLRAFGSGPPITVLLDAAGQVKHVQRGEFDDVAQIEALVEQNLGIRL